MGWIDTLHGFGDWEVDRPLERAQVVGALRELEGCGVDLKVYVNHGGYNMFHNVGGPWGYYQMADVESHPCYSLDLLQEYGFTYFWSDPFYELSKFGEDLTYADQAEFDEAFASHDFARFFFSNDPDDYSKSREVFPKMTRVEVRATERSLFNHILVPATMRDGRRAHFFKRFRGPDAPTAGNFILQVNPVSLDELEKRGGAVVIYQHFGVWRAMMMGKGHASSRASAPACVLDEHNAWALRDLAERFRSGRILVTTTRRLLDFVRMRDYLRFHVSLDNENPIITIGTLDCPVSGPVTPTVSDLEGLAFEISPDGPVPVVELSGSRIPMHVVSLERSRVLYRPWEPLVYPQ